MAVGCEDVLRAIIRIAPVLGHTLRHKPNVNWHHDYGILILRDHAVVLRNGLVFDADGTVTDAADWMVLNRYRTSEGILIEEGV